MGLWHDARACKVWGAMGLDRVRNEDICESLGRVAMMGMRNEKEENLDREAKGNELRQTW